MQLTRKSEPPSNSLYTAPSPEDSLAFLILCYFGRNAGLSACVARAYRDLNRTLHGFAKHDRAEPLRDDGHQCVESLIADLPNKKIVNQEEFDIWHEQACAELQRVYLNGQFERFTVGHAQKWLNMSMKYVYTLGKDRLPGYERFYKFAHIPIDNIFLDLAFRKFGIPKLRGPWSRINEYHQYLQYQITCRNEFESRYSGSSPLAVEFQVWLTASDLQP